MNIKKILIAHRSEIALRIIATCKARSIKTVALFTQEDRNSPHVFRADEAYKLTEHGSYGYLNQDEIISIARQALVDAIHPGYGFLAENHTFAQKVIDHGFNWIGPQPEHIKIMGDKLQARKLMEQLDIPVPEGITLDARTTSIHEAEAHAHTIGFPLLIKSAAGGGGKAMRMTLSQENFQTDWQRVVSESLNYFSSSHIIIEKLIGNSRHIEVQIAGDGKNVVHFFERECSVQRRQQKIIEESPTLFISNTLRTQLFQTACTIAQALHYTNVGTVEFLVTPDEKFYFLEMNTRLQVEHSVTEMTTGIDLVDLQIILAQGEKIPFQQSEIQQRGHALECRIYAEDPSHNFAPSTGTISSLEFPPFPFTRYDHALCKGTQITPHFDPMIAKITVFSSSRPHTLSFMIHILNHIVLTGITTNIDLLKLILHTEDFCSGTITTQWLHNHHTRLDRNKKSTNPVTAAAAFLISTSLSSTGETKTEEKEMNHWREQLWR